MICLSLLKIYFHCKTGKEGGFVIKIAAVGVAAVLFAMQLREMKPQYGMYVVFGAGILIFFYAFSKLEGIVEAVEKLREYVTIEEAYIEILFKMLGITYVSEFAASLCKDSGYSSLAGQIELFGKLSILLISMPVVLSLLKTLGQLFL